MTMAQISPVAALKSDSGIKSEPNMPQMQQDAQKVNLAVQTDTVTISPQAIKMASGNTEWVRVPPWKVRDKDDK